MKKSNFEPHPVGDIVRGNFVAQVPPEGTPERIMLELEGDAALAKGRFEDALALYKTAKGTSWHLKSKMGFCCAQIGKWAEGAQLLADAPDRDDAIALAMLIDCIDKGEPFDSPKREALPGLVRTLLALSTPIRYAFELADRHLPDLEERHKHLEMGHRLFPSSADMRRRYIRSAWMSGADQGAELMQLVRASIASDEAEPLDLWLAYKVLSRQERYVECSEILDRLEAKSDPASAQILALAKADLHTRAGDYAKAAPLYRAVRDLCASAKDDMTEIAIAASRGLFVIGMAQDDRQSIGEAAACVMRLFDRYGPVGQACQCHPLRPEPVYLYVGTEPDWYLAEADLTTVPGAVIEAIEDPDVRAFFKVMSAVKPDCDIDMLEDDAIATILAAALESDATRIRRSVAWALLQAGQIEAAGREFARLEWERVVALPGCWIECDEPGMFDDPRYDSKETVDLFAKGMIEFLLSAAHARNEWLGDHLHDIFRTYLREPVLRHELHDRFFVATKGVIDLYLRADHKPSATEWFDYGLACHYKSDRVSAAQAYRACLALEPTFSAAQKNLTMVLPQEDLSAMIIEREIRGGSGSTPPTSIDEITLEEAVYLLTLYRACGGVEQDLVLLPFGQSEHPFSPTLEMRQPIVSMLDAGIIRISDRSPAEAFVVNIKENRVQAFILDQIYWELPTSTMKLIREIEAVCLSEIWPASWREQAPALAHKLAQHECLAYLRACADERRLPMPDGEKTFLMIDNVLSTYSVSQGYAIFWQGVVAAVDFYHRNKVTAAHAGNTVVGNCQRRADRARTEGWDIKSYARPKDVRRSSISYVLHDAFLGSGEKAFTVPLAQLFDPKPAR